MTYEEHLEVSYWAVMSTLQADAASLAVLDQLRPRFLDALPSGSPVAGDLLCNALSDIDWDWPLWHPFAKSEESSTLADIDAEIDGTAPAEMLSLATNAQLRALCRDSGVRVSSSAVKAELIEGLRKTLSDASFAELARPFAERERARLKAACRREMATVIAARVASIAQNTERYEQLLDPDFAALAPFWKFHYVDYFGGEERRCKRLDGKILPIEKALAEFPHLPCDYLQCSCRISTEHGPG